MNILEEANKIYSKKSKTRFYYIWRSMRSRCNNIKNDSYARYGGRGIVVQDRWMEFSNFYDDIIQVYLEAGGDKSGVQIDRIDNDGSYESGNIRFVSAKVNNNNKSSNVVIDGKTLSEWADYFNLDNTKRQTMYKRYSSYGATTIHELFSDKYLPTLRAEIKNWKPCVVCGKINGTMRKGKNYPVRKKGMCNTCYCREYRRIDNETRAV